MRIANVIVLLLACAGTTLSADSHTWFSPQQVQQGQALFRQHCAACHGQNAEATPNWRQSDDQGRFPPPPLNGSAHTWHHSLDTLRLTVREGGQKLGGWDVSAKSPGIE